MPDAEQAPSCHTKTTRDDNIVAIASSAHAPSPAVRFIASTDILSLPLFVTRTTLAILLAADAPAPRSGRGDIVR
ncbi:hypothetical protein [Massilia sp. CCM 8734]|uniref:hypothetical protein n=1 Tax=Massilia sp. CCM 8734 TaxID=2609283 RepID=UPI001421605E|nr:hypothetical protein [Massilia sp. CCM 8734]NHZ96808.1 hypothetical protein [Massilia sp. CCM 8734]